MNVAVCEDEIRRQPIRCRGRRTLWRLSRRRSRPPWRCVQIHAQYSDHRCCAREPARGETTCGRLSRIPHFLSPYRSKKTARQNASLEPHWPGARFRFGSIGLHLSKMLIDVVLYIVLPFYKVKIIRDDFALSRRNLTQFVAFT